MRRFIEKSIILIFCLFNTYQMIPEANLVIYFLISMIISFSLDLVKYKNIRLILYFIFIGLLIYDSGYAYYLPLILYNLYLDYNSYIFLTLPLLLINLSLLSILISIISVYMSVNSHRYSLFIDQNKIVRDGLKEDAIYLKRYNEQLKIDREKNIHIAVLTERNRIARELHDSIGHVLSSSILQVEALKTVTDDLTNEGLDQLQDTLNNGMDDISNSIHNLHRESFDLKNRIENLLSDLKNMDIELNYGLKDELPYDLKFDILSIIKEGVTNCIKHSNATEIKISLISQPKFYTIIIRDNGSNYKGDKIKSNDGIGLISMNEIAEKYNGFMNYGFKEGFKIHITLMKG